jgi:hypothetical protein
MSSQDVERRCIHVEDGIEALGFLWRVAGVMGVSVAPLAVAVLGAAQATPTPNVRAAQRATGTRAALDALKQRRIKAIGSVAATDADPGDTLGNWQIKGGSGASMFAIDRKTGRLTLENPAAVHACHDEALDLVVSVDDGKNTSRDESVVIQLRSPGHPRR